MHEPNSWRVSSFGAAGATQPGRGNITALSRRIIMTLGLSGALMGSASLAMAQDVAKEELKPSIISLKASKTLLLDVEQAGERLIAVGSRGHIVYSDDQGGNWLQAPAPVRQLLTAVDFVDERHGWAVGHDSLILHSADGGESWSVQYRDPEIDASAEGFDFLEKPLMDVWFRDARTGFAVGAYGLFLRTEDGGKTWEDVSFDIDNPDGFHYNALTMVKDTGLFLVGEMGTMYRSPDFGDTWETLTDMPYDGSWFGVTGTGEPGGVLAWGLRGNMFRSTDFGDTWEQVTLQSPNNGELEATLAGGQLTADGRIIVVGAGGVVAISKDRGRSFEVTVRPDRVALANATGLADGGVLLVGQRGVMKADEKGLSAAGGTALTLPVPTAEEE
ncbi:BNR/Asp-box repeat-containing protein [Pseudomonas saudimassiliensis]|uniref:BNR/Asp-box repeat-containing protein n=1 Tax=Pseudomonas saudimassiliensis TaxID=1461581 RepID=A0A078MJG3_9PSED|nr:BNR/Asp-box repeat-containing protein [Pseudomonas saudimassiliensis]CEF27809.1 BNR/Asp-box repeat-containing protein [Pseudomonas saudimassiliensis]